MKKKNSLSRPPVWTVWRDTCLPPTLWRSGAQQPRDKHVQHGSRTLRRQAIEASTWLLCHSTHDWQGKIEQRQKPKKKQKKTINNLHRRGSSSPFLVKDRRRVPELPISFAARSTDVYLAPELTGPFGPLGRQTVKRTRDSGDRVDRTVAARAA